jgi:predicted O-methyltransferase YrrM
MVAYLADDVAWLGQSLAPDPDAVIAAMDERAEREDFPTVGRAMGGWLRLLARAVDAECIFEFGSGFGYSAYWMAAALPADGELVLTEIDADELEDARENLERGGYGDLARFEHGDAVEIVAEYDGPFDVVLIDNEKTRYREAFEAVRSKVAVGGVVVADNAIRSHTVDVGEIRDRRTDTDADVHESSAGVAEYLDAVEADPAFETALLPGGSGAAVSLRTE